MFLGGEVQQVKCGIDFFSLSHTGYCHLMHPITCHLSAQCSSLTPIPPENRFDLFGGFNEYCAVN